MQPEDKAQKEEEKSEDISEKTVTEDVTTEPEPLSPEEQIAASEDIATAVQKVQQDGSVKLQQLKTNGAEALNKAQVKSNEVLAKAKEKLPGTTAKIGDMHVKFGALVDGAHAKFSDSVVHLDKKLYPKLRKELVAKANKHLDDNSKLAIYYMVLLSVLVLATMVAAATLRNILLPMLDNLSIVSNYMLTAGFTGLVVYAAGKPAAIMVADKGSAKLAEIKARRQTVTFEENADNTVEPKPDNTIAAELNLAGNTTSLVTSFEGEQQKPATIAEAVETIAPKEEPEESASAAPVPSPSN